MAIPSPGGEIAPEPQRGDPEPDTGQGVSERFGDGPSDSGSGFDSKGGWPNPPPRLVIAVSVIIAVALTVWVRPAPTGTEIVDLVYGAGFASLVTIAAAIASSRSRGWAAANVMVALFFSGLAAGSFSSIPWALVAAAALGVAIVADNESWGAPIGAATVGALWHIAPLGMTGVPSAWSLIAVGPVLVEALRQARHQHPTLLRFVTQLAVAAIAWTIVAAGWTLYSSRASIERVSSATENATVLFSEGRLSGALAESTVAARHASVVEARLGQWWNRGLSAVPIVAQNLRAGTVMLDGGRSVLRVAKPLINEDISIRHVDGRVDVDGVAALSDWVEPLARQAGFVAQGAQSVDSVWLWGRFGEALREVEDAGFTVANRSEELVGLVEAAPDLLGGDEPKRYLILFMTPVEARELEGLVGNWALLIADDGLVRVERVGRIKDLNSKATGEGFADPDSYPKRYISYNIPKYFQNVTASPDFPTVARGAAEIFPQMGGVPIDGVAAVDPYTIGALVGATGPISIPGFADPFDEERVTQFLLFDQYQQLPDLEQREIVLETLTRDAFSILVAGGRLDRLLAAFDGPIDQRRFLFTTFDDDINSALETLGLRGVFPAPVDEMDTISVRHDSAVARKLDGYIEREMSYSIISDPDQDESKIQLRVKITNSTPYGLLPYVAGTEDDYAFPDGSALAPNDHLLRLSVYTTAELNSVEVENEVPSPQVPDHYTEEEFGYHRHYLWIVARQGESVVVTFELTSTYAPGPDEPVVVRVLPQPLVNDDYWRFAATWADPATARTRNLGPQPVVAPATVVLAASD